MLLALDTLVSPTATAGSNSGLLKSDCFSLVWLVRDQLQTQDTVAFVMAVLTVTLSQKTQDTNDRNGHMKTHYVTYAALCRPVTTEATGSRPDSVSKSHYYIPDQQNNKMADKSREQREAQTLSVREKNEEKYKKRTQKENISDT